MFNACVPPTSAKRLPCYMPGPRRRKTQAVPWGACSVRRHSHGRNPSKTADSPTQAHQCPLGTRGGQNQRGGWLSLGGQRHVTTRGKHVGAVGRPGQERGCWQARGATEQSRLGRGPQAEERHVQMPKPSSGWPGSSWTEPTPAPRKRAFLPVHRGAHASPRKGSGREVCLHKVHSRGRSPA